MSEREKNCYMAIISSIMLLAEEKNVSYKAAARALCVGIQALVDSGGFDNDNSTK